VRFGVIGAGWFASRRHIPDIRNHPEAELAALCRRDPEALERLRAHFRPEAVFTDWREMLDRARLDAVLIATPHNAHFEPALEALERGLHVLIEQPMTVAPEEARALCRLADEKGLTLGVALNPPYWAHCHRIRSAIAHGRIGALESASLFWTGNSRYVFGEAPKPPDLPGLVPPTLFRADPGQCGGGCLIDGGSHLVSELLWVTGQAAVAVSCQMDSLPSDRRAVLAVTLEDGAVATICSVADSGYRERRVRNTFAGADGTIAVEGFEFLTTIQHEGGAPESFQESDLPPVPGPVANFIDAVAGRGHLFSPGEHGADVVAVIHAAYESARTGARAAVQG